MSETVSEQPGGTGEPFSCGGLVLSIYQGEPAHWRQEGKIRTCSMCGGMHRQDVARLLREGARINASDKRHKSYLSNHPDLANIRGAAKFYTWHPIEADGPMPPELQTALVEVAPFRFGLPGAAGRG